MNPEPGTELRRPLGYWLKLLDQLIEEHLDHVLMRKGIRRRHWQVMNLLKRHTDRGGRSIPATRKDIAEQLGPFWSGSEVTLSEVLNELIQRGWLTKTEPYGLTAAGEGAHAILAPIVQQAAGRIDDGVTAQEHAATVDVLRRMTANAQNRRHIGHVG
ncbi:MarR family transcriptional regulator [Actinomadura sp. KC345]|uniref:MarR family winged helix-turn-helix transcriptional regulator n=1 Tax=Actinomadura sp. KC345 TaxID=2530371 RepID=UPI00104A3DDD|nr:MarR family transcriptional regulator [Actinomadura sp. KC345]TDC55610.1 MarR family transcriptional regulator [Actinomadura sp. KC345]